MTLKKISLLLSFLLLLAIPFPSFANNLETTTVESITIEDAGNGCYYKTVIETISADSADTSIGMLSTQSTKTGRKTTYYYNASGSVLWYVRVTGKFTYGNGTSICTSASAAAEAKSSSWKIASKSSSRSGNTAKATATAKQYLNGAPVGSVTKSATLKCSSTGTLS